MATVSSSQSSASRSAASAPWKPKFQSRMLPAMRSCIVDVRIDEVLSMVMSNRKISASTSAAPD